MSGSAVAGVDYNLRFLDIAVVRGPTLVSARQHALGVDLASRIAVIQRALDELIATPDAPSVIVMEKTWMREGRGMGTAQALHRIPHYVEALAAERGLEVEYVPVNTWHRNILGNGRVSSEAGKVLSVQMVKRLYQYDADSADQADAICLATYGVNLLRREGALGGMSTDLARDNGASLAGRYGIANNHIAAWLLARGQGELLALTPDELRKPMQAPMCRAQKEEQDKKWRWHRKPGQCCRPMLYRPQGWSCYEHKETQRQPLGMVLQDAPQLIDYGDGDGARSMKRWSLDDLLALAGKTVDAEYSAPNGGRPAWRYVVR